MEEQFSGVCAAAIAAFDEFSKLLGDPASTRDFDHVIFDTAPIGHMERMRHHHDHGQGGCRQELG